MRVVERAQSVSADEATVLDVLAEEHRAFRERVGSST